jgi:hypothetical protein
MGAHPPSLKRQTVVGPDRRRGWRLVVSVVLAMLLLAVAAQPGEASRKKQHSSNTTTTHFVDVTVRGAGGDVLLHDGHAFYKYGDTNSRITIEQDNDRATLLFDERFDKGGRFVRLDRGAGAVDKCPKADMYVSSEVGAVKGDALILCYTNLGRSARDNSGWRLHYSGCVSIARGEANWVFSADVDCKPVVNSFVNSSRGTTLGPGSTVNTAFEVTAHVP